jgi:hypothetical protein
MSDISICCRLMARGQVANNNSTAISHIGFLPRDALFSSHQLFIESKYIERMF